MPVSTIPMINVCDILKERELRGNRNESVLSKVLEDSFLANYSTEPFDFIRPVDNPLSTIAIAVSPDGDTVATTHGDHTVKVFKISSGALLQTFRGLYGKVLLEYLLYVFSS